MPPEIDAKTEQTTTVDASGIQPPASETAEEGKQERAAEGMTPDQFRMYLPIGRSDAANRVVYGQATAEVPDSYGTIFGYYPEAWQKWRGNIREQHDPKKAVGKALEVEPDSQERSIYVGAKVSRGAQDTWMKVEDGVLTGFSACIVPDKEYGPDPRRWPKKEYNGKQYPYLPRYSVAELSLVDNPSCPKCDIQIVRADGFTTEVVDNEPEPEQPPAETTPTTEPETLERVGARISTDSRGALHTMRDHAIQLCNCQECTRMVDCGQEPPADEVLQERMQEILERSIAPVYQRQQSFLARLAQFDTHYQIIQEKLAQLDTAIGTVLERVKDVSKFDEVRADLSAVKDQLQRVVDAPMPGGPVLNGARPYDKTTPYQAQAPTMDRAQVERETIERLHAGGALRTMNDQVGAAALILQRQPMHSPS